MRALHYVNSAEHDDKNVQFGFCVCARERNIESKPPLFYSSAEFCFLAPLLLPQIFGQNMTKMRNKNHSADKCASPKK
jgi:hypothetical protein